MASRTFCVECNVNDPWSRGLCTACYAAAQRGKFLNDYPTRAFTDDPESHTRWAFANPDLVADIAIEFGYELRKIN